MPPSSPARSQAPAAVPAAPSPARGPGAWLWAALLASVALVAVVWAVPYLPTNDGPEHVLLGHIENHFDDPGAVYPRYLRPAPQFAGRGFAALFVPLEAVLPWRHALRAALSVALLAWAWGYVALVAAFAPARRRWVALAGFAFACQWALYLGFFPFVVGSAAGMFVLALALAPRVRPAVRAGGVAALLLAQAVMHAFTALITLAVLALLALLAPGATPEGAAPRARLRAALRVALAAVPALAVVALTAREQPAVRATPLAHATEWLPVGELLAQVPRFVQPGPRWRGLAALALAVAGVGAAALRHRRRDPALTATERALAVAAAALLLASALAPWNVPGWQMFAPRFAPLGAMLGVALLPLERLAPRAAAGLAGALVAAYLGSGAALHRRLAAACADAIATLDAPVPPAALVLPVPAAVACAERNEWIAAEVPGLAPCLHFGALYAAAHGGLPRYMFSSSAAGHSVTLRAAMPPAPPVEHLAALAADRGAVPARRAALLDEFAAAGAGYDAVLLLAPARDAARFAARGYRTVFAQGEARVARFVGCAATVALPAGTALEASAPRIEFGWFPLRAASWRGTAADAGATRAPDGTLRVTLPGAPCGPVWVRVVWDRDGSGDLTPGDGVCGGADRDGKLVRVVEPQGATTIACDPAR